MCKTVSRSKLWRPQSVADKLKAGAHEIPFWVPYILISSFKCNWVIIIGIMVKLGNSFGCKTPECNPEEDLQEEKHERNRRQSQATGIEPTWTEIDRRIVMRIVAFLKTFFGESWTHPTLLSGSKCILFRCTFNAATVPYEWVVQCSTKTVWKQQITRIVAKVSPLYSWTISYGVFAYFRKKEKKRKCSVN